ncbi:MAG: hypothetical protein APF77_01230 [Clostridia bacterium BRH_c25]|nr:MAG: hypothetical protein APF77_01230 [Clostridia bacterium BRH_c25]
MSPEQQAIVNLKRLLYQARLDYWINANVLTLRWWVLLFYLIIPWFVWYRLVDKRRLKEMLLYLLLTAGIATLLDEIGANLTMWIYPIKVIPALPCLITANYSVVPIIYVLIYQYFPRWKSFIVANIILTLVFSFILEPILVWAKLYYLITWKYSYSVPIYFFAAIFLKWFAGKLMIMQNGPANIEGSR